MRSDHVFAIMIGALAVLYWYNTRRPNLDDLKRMLAKFEQQEWASRRSLTPLLKSFDRFNGLRRKSRK